MPPEYDAATLREYCGTVALTPTNAVAAGSWGTWTFTFTVGKYGMDDRSNLRLVMRGVCDWGAPDFDDPTAPNYCRIFTDGNAKLQVHFDRENHVRPWRRTIHVHVHDGTLAAGQRIWIVMGDTSGGSPGSQAQTFVESTFEFKFFADNFGTLQFRELPDAPVVRIVAGPAARLVAQAPSMVAADEEFAVLVRADDAWGNTADGFRGEVGLFLPHQAEPLASHTFNEGDGGVYRFSGLSLDESGIARLEARCACPAFSVLSNPIYVQADTPALRLYWGDMHAQTEETVGTGSPDEYFTYARDHAGVDFLGIQGNDFQVTAEFWYELQEIVKRYNDPGGFLTLLGYEWSGNHPAGGDHNVHFLGDEGPLHRSSHWQVPGDPGPWEDMCPVSKLVDHYRGLDDVFLIPHIGGRRANLDYFDAEVMPLIEIASAHGWFEWVWQEALERGYITGFAAGSDDHTGRPGTSRPTNGGMFGVRGGLLGAYAPALQRRSVWDAIRARRTFASTGARMILNLTADGHAMGEVFSSTNPPLLDVKIAGAAPLEKVEVLRGTEVVYSHPLVEAESGLPRKLRVGWRGARVKDRTRRLRWDGSLRVEEGRIVSAKGWAFDDPTEGIVEWNEESVRWVSQTSGDWDGVALEIAGDADTTLHFTSAPAVFSVNLDELIDRNEIVRPGTTGVASEVRISRDDEDRAPYDTAFTYQDPAPLRQDVTPYFVRVTQCDGEMAWCSPVFVKKA